MARFTVIKRGGISDFDFEAYESLLLNQSKIDVNSMDRVPEPGRNDAPQTRDRWLPVWESRDEARRFAKDLEVRTRQRGWVDYELTPDEDRRVDHGPLSPLEINVNKQTERCTYALHPNSRRRVLKAYPDRHPISAVTLDDSTVFDMQRTGHEAFFGPAVEQVALILTNLNGEDLRHLGGVEIYDRIKKEVLGRIWNEVGAGA